MLRVRAGGESSGQQLPEIDATTAREARKYRVPSAGDPCREQRGGAGKAFDSGNSIAMRAAHATILGAFVIGRCDGEEAFEKIADQSFAPLFGGAAGFEQGDELNVGCAGAAGGASVSAEGTAPSSAS